MRVVEQLLPYRAEQMFDLAADVERYPEFLPLWIYVRILRREPGACYTEQAVGLGPLRLQFESRALLLRPRRIDVTSDDPQFSNFRLSWIFQARPSGWCMVRLAAVIELRSRLLHRAADRALRGAAGDIIAAFEARARHIYGRAAIPPPALGS